MTRFEHFVAIDWSGAKGAVQKGIALAVAHGDGGPPVLVDHGWSREDVLSVLRDELPPDTLIGIDLGIALPFADCDDYFPEWSQSPRDAKELWRLIDTVCAGDPHLEATSFVAHPQASRYFRHGKDSTGDRFHHPAAPTREGRFRKAEDAQRSSGVRPVSNFNLVGAAQVGKSSLTGMRMLHRLRGHLPVWPIDPLPANGSVLVEIYTSLAAREAGRGAGKAKMRSFAELNEALAALGSAPVLGDGPIDDHSTDALLTAAWLRKVAHDRRRWDPPGLTGQIAQTEGWTFGAL